MKKKKDNSWVLNPNEVATSMHGFSSGQKGQFDRKLKTTSQTIFLTHKSTGIKVKGEIPEGNYSKKEMQQKVLVLKNTLFKKLEKLVAKQLHIKGL